MPLKVSLIALLMILLSGGALVLSGMAMAQDLDKATAAIYLEEAKNLAEQGKIEEALAKVEMAREADPSSPEAARWHGYLLSSLGRKEEAIEAFAEAIELGENSGYSARNLANLMLTGRFPRWINPTTLPYLPVKFEPFDFDLADPRVPFKNRRGIDGVITTSMLYPPIVPMPGPDGMGRFNRVAYGFILNPQTSLYELRLQVNWGSEFLWNVEWDSYSAARSVAAAVCSALLYTNAYLPNSGAPSLDSVVEVWFYQEPGEDRWERRIILIHDVTEPREEAEWFKLVYGLLGETFLFPTELEMPREQKQEIAAELVAFWSLINRRSSPIPMPGGLIPLQEQALGSLNSFFEMLLAEQESESYEPAPSLGALLYLCSACDLAAIEETLHNYAQSGGWNAPQIIEVSSGYSRVVLDPILRSNASPLNVEDFVRDRADREIAVAPGTANYYLVSLPAAKWRLEIVARAASESSIIVSLDGKDLAQASASGTEWKKFLTGVRVREAGWHRLGISVPADKAPLILRKLQLIKLAES